MSRLKQALTQAGYPNVVPQHFFEGQELLQTVPTEKWGELTEKFNQAIALTKEGGYSEVLDELALPAISNIFKYTSGNVEVLDVLTKLQETATEEDWHPAYEPELLKTLLNKFVENYLKNNE